MSRIRRLLEISQLKGTGERFPLEHAGEQN
jgi:hypothetical protein